VVIVDYSIEIDESKAVIQEIKLPGIQTSVRVFIKRLDLIHPHISGNKWYKLKYNLEKAKRDRYKTLLTFGGAYSNHIYAVAAAGKAYGFETIGIVRGEQHLPLNPTLSFAVSQGMKIYYKDRATFRLIHGNEISDQIRREFGEVYILPEGGTNELAVKGCGEIIKSIDIEYDFLCVPCGTGGTISGLICGANGVKKILGFSVLKGGGFLSNDIERLVLKSSGKHFCNWDVNLDYHFGGYARISGELVTFMKDFESLNNIPLDFVYTGKMMFGIAQLIKNNFFPENSKVVCLHTGGLQGNEGMRRKTLSLENNSEQR
jgi:1-aminocyclopropane-1-carboxylate deaminase/D-cysteine desulfhydrase-like pyridoxal-dependent ACC family enzyme